MANNTDSALEDAGREDGFCRDNKTCLWMTVVGGVCLLITEIIIAGVTLIAPKDVGISADDELCAGQRAFLGGFTVIIFLEGALIASWDWYREGFDPKEKEKRKEMKDNTKFIRLQYAATVIFGEAVFMAIWIVALLLVTNNWLAVSVTAIVAVTFPLLKFWHKLIDPFAE